VPGIGTVPPLNFCRHYALRRDEINAATRSSRSLLLQRKIRTKSLKFCGSDVSLSANLRLENIQMQRSSFLPSVAAIRQNSLFISNF